MTEKISYLHPLKLKFGNGFAKDLIGGECQLPLKVGIQTSSQNGLSIFYCLKSPTGMDICCRFTRVREDLLATAFPSNRGLCGGECKN